MAKFIVYRFVEKLVLFMWFRSGKKKIKIKDFIDESKIIPFEFPSNRKKKLTWFEFRCCVYFANWMTHIFLQDKRMYECDRLTKIDRRVTFDTPKCEPVSENDRYLEKMINFHWNFLANYFSLLSVQLKINNERITCVLYEPHS